MSEMANLMSERADLRPRGYSRPERADLGNRGLN